MRDIKNRTCGYWMSIYQSLGISVGDGRHTGCPICGSGNNNHRFRMDDKDGAGTWICSQCGAGDGFSLIMKVLTVDFKGAVEAVENIIGTCKKQPINNGLQYNPERLRALYKNSKPLTGNCLGSDYLKSRGLSTFPATLRYIRECYEPSTKEKLPAILATFSAPDGEAITLHRTYLSLTGNKADIENPKLTMTPKKEMKGGAVRLFPATDTIGVSEGLETAIACHESLNGWPVWATLSTSLMVAFEPPAGIKTVIIFSDNDKNYAGQKAAYTLANKLVLKNFTVDVQVPETPGNDFLDELLQTRGEHDS